MKILFVILTLTAIAGSFAYLKKTGRLGGLDPQLFFAHSAPATAEAEERSQSPLKKPSDSRPQLVPAVRPTEPTAKSSVLERILAGETIPEARRLRGRVDTVSSVATSAYGRLVGGGEIRETPRLYRGR